MTVQPIAVPAVLGVLNNTDSKYEEGAEPAVKPVRIVDPTGCGDAFRAGFVHAQLLGASKRDAVRCGAGVACINIESLGTQAHSLDNLADRYSVAWKERPSWL